MALIDIEGGDHLNSGLFTAKGWNLNPSALHAGRVRGWGWEIGSSPSGIQMGKVLPSTYSTVIVGVGFQMAVATASRAVLRVANAAGSTVVAAVSTNASGVLQVTNSAGTVIATGTTVIANATWYYVELKIVVGTSGSCELHLNGVSGEIASTTGNFGTTNVGLVALSGQADTANSNYFDDFYILDTTGSSPQNDFLGDVTVETLFPNGDGTHQDWTPSAAGAHFSKVNESTGTYPDGDTSYVSDITPGDIDTYTVGSLATLTGTVFGVATNLYARKDDAAGRTVAPVIREAGTDHVGSTTPGLSTSYLFYRQLYQADPAGAAWTIASVNAAEYGIKEVS